MASIFFTLFAVVFCTSGFVSGLKCKTVARAQKPWWQNTDFRPLENFVADRQTDGIDGYCDSWSDSSPVCLSLTSRGHLYIRGAKKHDQPYTLEGHAEELDYFSCDYGLVVRRRNHWVGWICRQLDGEYSSSLPSWPANRPKNTSCYHWDNIQNAYFGTPDVSVPGYALAGYQIILLNASLTIHCCRNGDRCNEFLPKREQCEFGKPFPFDQYMRSGKASAIIT